jgi:type I restriction enzyme, R subunit
MGKLRTYSIVSGLMAIDELEWRTRKERIDTRLRACHPPWTILKFRPGLEITSLDGVAVEEYPTDNGPADYALFVGGQFLAIIEAKKVAVNPQNVLEQAKRYARGATNGPGNWEGLKVPFLYATNGELIWHLDTRGHKYISRQISNFHTSAAMAELFKRDSQQAFNWLLDNPIDRIARLRPYQQQAIFSAEKAIMNGRRQMLLALATGTGKTFLTVAMIYRLLESKAAKRILFLVDRKALAAQAVREFAAFSTPRGNKLNQEYEVYSQRFQREDFADDQPFDPKVLPETYLAAPDETHTFLYVSTIQRMTINLFGREAAFSQDGNDPEIEEDAGKVDIPIHTFDVIVADECHRGYTSSETAIWRQTLQHFDAIKIGLTATPAAHTVAFFGEPIFRYTVEQGVQDGYLVDYDAVSIHSDVRLNGAFLKPGESVGMVDTTTGEEVFDQLEDERQFASTEIERKITAPESNRKIVQEIAKYAHAHEERTGRFPKILVFAANDLPHTSHADQLVRICREEFNQGDEFVQKITGNPNVDRPLQRIREFRNRPNPKVVISVDMLTTGVDIPALEFIAFLRPVKSRILWEQMLGRGTRRCPDINKTHFTIFDGFGGSLIEYFKDASAFKVEALQKEAVPLAQVIENIWNNVDRDYNVRVLVRRLQRIEKDMSGDARQQFAQYIEDGDMGRFATSLPRRLKLNFAPTMKLLRDATFQDLLLNYLRSQRSFLVGYEVGDNVTSEWKFKVEDEYLKPEDYLTHFAKFIRAKSSEIEALQVLMHRPQDWRTDVLTGLREKLRSASFAERDLQRASELVHHRLADIISLVKHAALDEAPIFTAEERVDRAMSQVQALHMFTGEQQQWLQLIREHLVKNLTIELDDFDLMPIFSDRGGLGRAKRLFDPNLHSMLKQINKELASV